MKEQLHKAWAWIVQRAPYAVQLRVLLIILGGTGLLGLVAEFATYSYAIYFGFRVPVEGVPYLRAAVTLVSFVSILLCILGFTVIYFLANVMLVSIDTLLVYFSKLLGKNEQLLFSEIFSIIRTRPPLWLFFLCVVTSGLYASILTFVLPEPFNALSFIDIVNNSAVLFFATFLTFMFVTVSVFIPKIIKNIAILAGAVSLIFIPALLFHADSYANFLRITGFGGGRLVSIEFRNDSESQAREIAEGYLLLRTQTYTIIYEEIGNEVLEIPNTTLHKIRYPLEFEHKLPTDKRSNN